MSHSARIAETCLKHLLNTQCGFSTMSTLNGAMSPKKYLWNRVLKMLSSSEAPGSLSVGQEGPLPCFHTLCAGSLTTIASDSGLRSTFWRLFPSLFPFSVAGFLLGQREEENTASFRDTLDSSLFSDYLRCHVCSVNHKPRSVPSFDLSSPVSPTSLC